MGLYVLEAFSEVQCAARVCAGGWRSHQSGAKLYLMSAPAKNKNKSSGKKQSAVDFLLESADRIAAEVPASELEKLPIDGGQNLDHYLYGAPKQ
jgi:hypothetical protein